MHPEVEGCGLGVLYVHLNIGGGGSAEFYLRGAEKTQLRHRVSGRILGEATKCSLNGFELMVSSRSDGFGIEVTGCLKKNSRLNYNVLNSETVLYSCDKSS